jgi:hypothetical protein
MRIEANFCLVERRKQWTLLTLRSSGEIALRRIDLMGREGLIPNGKREMPVPAPEGPEVWAELAPNGVGSDDHLIISMWLHGRSASIRRAYEAN